ncbi:unnamed protein product [Ceutorhynchus assimilis]|uniref:Uncharacterized protein n=1 Tax=Ceutorhynchus assimilis TaxID=467358 RepID=A0A9N9MFX5_9CUCU|nr:unnamed protein product [Ceutorhynchus assimilis]
MAGPVTLENIKSLLVENSNSVKSELVRKLDDIFQKHSKKNKKQYEELSEQCLKLERRVRKNNILIFGFTPETSNNIYNETVEKLNSLLSLNLSLKEVNNIYRLGNKENSPIVVEFLSFIRKLDIFKDKEKLKNLKNLKISIANDLCPSDREEQKILLKHLRKNRDNNIECTIKGFKLQIGNNSYSAKDLVEANTNTNSDTEYDTEEDSPDTEEERKNNKEKTPTLTENQKKEKKKIRTPPSPAHTRNHGKKPRRHR